MVEEQLCDISQRRFFDLGLIFILPVDSPRKVFLLVILVRGGMVFVI